MAKPEKAVVGRPSKYKPEYCKLFVERSAEGQTFRMLAHEIGVNVDTINQWTKVHPEFSEAIKNSHLAYGKWIDSRLLDASSRNPKEVNTAILIFLAKTKGGYRDVQTVEMTGPSQWPSLGFAPILADVI